MADRPWSANRQERARRAVKRGITRNCDDIQERIVPLRVGEEFCVQSAVAIRVVKGAVSIWGAVLGPSASFTPVVCPAWAPLPRVVAEATSAIIRSQEAPAEEAPDIQEFIADHSWPVVLCVRPVLPNSGPMRLPTDGATSAAAAARAERLQRDAIKEAMLPPPELRRLVAHPAWQSVADHLLEVRGGGAVADSKVPRVVLVSGNTNVGKSFCCRFLANAMWSAEGDVYFLETDLGQPELTAPGLVSLHRLRAPLLSFSECRQLDRRHELVGSFAVGGTSPMADPMLYARSIRAAANLYFEACAGHDGCKPPPPLIVNSHGWVQSLGLDLVHTILRTVRAQVVVRIVKPKVVFTEDVASGEDSETKNKSLKRKRGFLTKCGPMACGLQDAACLDPFVDYPSVLVDVETRAPEGRQPKAHWTISAPEARWLRFAGHFRPDRDPLREPRAVTLRDWFGPLASIRLPLSKVKLGRVQGVLNADEADATFVGTVAALCTVVPMQQEGLGNDAKASGAMSPGAGDVGSVLEGSVARCVAYGYVHAIDHVAEEVVVYTPAAREELERVDLLLRGDVQWQPHSVSGTTVEAHGDAFKSASPLQPFCSSWTLEGISVGARSTTRTSVAGGR